jgi:hypothetical protein
MQPISQSIAPLLGYASPIEQPYQEEEAVPLGLLALVAKQQEEAQNQQAQVAQSPMVNALDGIGGLPSDELFNISGKDAYAMTRQGLNFPTGSKLGAMLDLSIGKAFANGPGIAIDRSKPLDQNARDMLSNYDPARLRRIDAYQKFDAANKEET